MRTMMVLGLMLASLAVQAADFTAGSLQIRQPWSRATPKGSTVAAGFFTIVNRGAQPDRLVGGMAAASGRFELHEMSMKEGVMQMRPLPHGIEIKPGETLEFRPGSLHVMFIGLKQPLAAGDRVKGTLVFEKAGSVAIEYEVHALGASPRPAH
jgi:copper(I)-binding protein